MIAALEFGRGIAFVLLVLPILVLVLARLRTRPEPDATGTIELWRRSARDVPRTSTRERARIPPAAWWLVCALVLSIVALADPRERAARDARSLTVVVDRSPSMYLLLDGRTRLERALDAARADLLRCDPERVTWIAPPSGSAAVVHAREIPAAWLRAPRVPRAAPDFAAYDQPNVLWITDRASATPPRRAGIAASGGPAVPGPIGVRGAALVEWDGAHVSERSAPASTRRVVVAATVPGGIAKLARTWAVARGLECAVGAITDPIDDSVALELRATAGAVETATVAGRDGWSARATRAEGAPASDAEGPLERWLVDPDGDTTLVSSGKGRVCIALRTLETPRGDPAAFAVSWSRLFDACVLDPSACIPWPERADAGLPAHQPPAKETAASETAASAWPAICALCAVVAALCAVVAQGTFRRAPQAALP